MIKYTFAFLIFKQFFSLMINCLNTEKQKRILRYFYVISTLYRNISVFAKTRWFFAGKSPLPTKKSTSLIGNVKSQLTSLLGFLVTNCYPTSLI
jgi:hypothetical protein